MIKSLIVAGALTSCITSANAQLYSFPAPPMTVANCPASQNWVMKNNLPTCAAPAPPPPPCCAPPPPPACQYSPGAFSIAIGDMGQCTADGGCEGKGYQILWGGSVVASQMWIGYMEWPELNSLASAGIDASGYRAGANKASYLSNGNNMGLGVYEVCRK